MHCYLIQIIHRAVHLQSCCTSALLTTCSASACLRQVWTSSFHLSSKQQVYLFIRFGWEILVHSLKSLSPPPLLPHNWCYPVYLTSVQHCSVNTAIQRYNYPPFPSPFHTHMKESKAEVEWIRTPLLNTHRCWLLHVSLCSVCVSLVFLSLFWHSGWKRLERNRKYWTKLTFAHTP